MPKTLPEPEAGGGRQSAFPLSASAVTVKLTDFGIGQVVSQEYLAGMTKAGFTATLLGSESSSHTGTQLYMAPELLAGKPASTRSDIYSLGVVLYQLMVADFARPAATDWADEISDPLLREDLQHCFAGKPEDRFAGVAQLARNLRALPQRQTERARQQAAVAAAEKAAYRRGVARVTTLAVALVGVFAALAVLAIHKSRVAQARDKMLRQLSYAADMRGAQRAVEENDRHRTVAALNRYLPKSGDDDLRGFEWRYVWSAARGDQIETLGGHEGVIACAQFSPDGKTIATAGFDGQALIRDAVSKQILMKLPVTANESVWLKMRSGQ